MKSHWLRAIFGYNLRAGFFPSMQFSQNVNEPQELSFYKHFRQNTWRDFLEKSKKHVSGPFLVIFTRWRFFQKKIRLCHTIIYGSLTPCYVSEKTNEPIPRKLTDRRKDGRTEGRTNRLYFIGPFRKRPGVQLQQKRQKKKKMIK